MAGRGTRATDQLAKLGIAYSVHPYDHDPRAVSYGLEASAALGVTPDRLFKTLVVEIDDKNLAVAVVPVAGSLDLKALAGAVGGKKAKMAEPAAERATGYVTGGISPLGQRRRLPVVVDESALDHETVFCSAGQRGLQVEIAPADLIRAAGAVVAPIGRGGS